MVGPKAVRHSERGDALSREEWQTLPVTLAHAKWYMDTETGNLIAVFEGKTQASVSRTGAVDTIYHDAAAAKKIDTGRWVEVR